MDQHDARFGGIGRLFSGEGLRRLRDAHVCVIGLGGVGSWAVEARARSGIGRLTLIDLDDVCISNVNRQLHAVTGEFGKPKVEVLARRVLAINPDCAVNPVQAFFLKSNAEEILRARFDAVLDAIDSPSRKALLLALCHERRTPVVTVGGAGGRRDPTGVEITDLALASHDRLLREVRRQLRRRYGFPRSDRPFGIECVISREEPVFPHQDGRVCAQRPESPDLRLDCNRGLGTACFVTGTFGFAAAARIVHRLAADPGPEKAPAPGAETVTPCAPGPP